MSRARELAAAVRDATTAADIERYALAVRAIENELSRLREALEAISHDDGCYGVCDAGRVRGAHLANHTNECARIRILLGESVPDGYRWNGDRLVYVGRGPA